MREPTNRRPNRFGKGPGRRGGPKGRAYSRADGNGANGGVNGNTLRGGQGEKGVCIKCGHPAPDGKLCSFHRSLLNTFRKEVPEQDPRRFRF